MVLLFWEPWKLVSLQQVQPSWVQKVSYSRRKNSIFSPSFISPLYFPFPLWFITGYGVQSPALCSRTLLSAHPVYDSLCLLIPNALPRSPLGNHMAVFIPASLFLVCGRSLLLLLLQEPSRRPYPCSLASEPLHLLHSFPDASLSACLGLPLCLSPLPPTPLSLPSTPFFCASLPLFSQQSSAKTNY